MGLTTTKFLGNINLYLQLTYTHTYILTKYWEFHKNKLFFDKQLFLQYIKETLSNTSLLAYLGKNGFS